MLDKNLFTTSAIVKRESIPPALGKLSNELAVQDLSGTDLQALDEKVKSLIEKGQKMIPYGGKRANGTPIHQRLSVCKVCGKEGLWNQIKNHIESNHLEGILIPCDYCGKTVSSRHRLTVHKKKIHK